MIAIASLWVVFITELQIGEIRLRIYGRAIYTAMHVRAAPFAATLLSGCVFGHASLSVHPKQLPVSCWMCMHITMLPDSRVKTAGVGICYIDNM